MSDQRNIPPMEETEVNIEGATRVVIVGTEKGIIEMLVDGKPFTFGGSWNDRLAFRSFLHIEAERYPGKVFIMIGSKEEPLTVLNSPNIPKL